MIDQLLGRWRDEGVHLQPGASENDIATIEALLGAQLPNDARALYERANGMEAYAHDGWFVSLWSADRMQSEREVMAGSDERGNFLQVAFADVMISAWFLWFRVRDGGGVTVFAEMTKEEFPTFSAFVEQYLRDPDALCLVAINRQSS